MVIGRRWSKGATTAVRGVIRKEESGKYTLHLEVPKRAPIIRNTYTRCPLLNAITA